jgi:AcrR family transcriptional regulator
VSRSSRMREESPAASRPRLSKDERRARILDAAAQVFADRGYESASLDEIAQAAGISKPVIYDHFASKKQLHISLLDSQTDQLLRFMTERVTAEQTVERQLAAGFHAFFEFVETHPYAWRLIFGDPTAADAEIVAAHDVIKRRATSVIAALAAANPMPRGAEDAEDDVLNEVFAQLIKTASNGLAAWWYDHRDVPRGGTTTATCRVVSWWRG